MTTINTAGLDHQAINEELRKAERSCSLVGCLGQRFIAAGASDKEIVVEGTPGNALGAYLNGAKIIVRGNAQDAVGDTMNEGLIAVYGNIGDAAGYAMRGGKIYAKGDAGYRVGVHMKAYRDKIPVVVIGGKTGSFLGEYQAGGVIVVLGLTSKKGEIVGDYPCAGMHGGKLFLRSDCSGIEFPKQVTARLATTDDIDELKGYVAEFCALFEYDLEEILDAPFTVATPDVANPYKQMYVAN